MDTIISKLKSQFFLFFILTLLLTACDKNDPFDTGSGTFTDKRDGHVYKWVKIGEQIWMAENLAYLPVHPCAHDAQCGVWVYGYEGEGPYGTNYNTYGCLYDWETAMEVCPEGWHLPSDEEWMELERFLGMEERELSLFSCRGVENNIGSKLASDDSNLWSGWGDNFLITNETGFSALPGGERNIRNIAGVYHFNSIEFIATFWTSNNKDNQFAINRTIVNDCVDRMLKFQDAGFSIRCIKD